MAFESPVSVLYNNEGNEIAVSQSQIINTPATQPGLMMAASGSDGRAYFLRVTNDGALFITGAIQTSAVTTQSVYMAGWHPTVTASVQLNFWGTNVTGTVNLVPSASVIATLVPSASIIVGGWQSNVTGNVGLNAWGTNVTGTVNLVTSASVIATLVPSASIIVGGWATAATASVRDIGASTTTVSAANASITNFTFLTSSVNRKGATFFKEGSNTVYIKLGATASATSYTVKLSNNGYYELPEDYTGQVDILFSTAVANNPLYVTEIRYP